MEAKQLAKSENKKYIWLCLASVLFFGFLAVMIHSFRPGEELFYGIVNGLTLVIAVLLGLAIMGKQGITEQTISYVIFCGILLRLFYIILTQGHYFQNDIGALQEGNIGHLGYVYYIWDNGKLPDVDPMISYQFYHPPLHYIIAAAFLKVFTLFGGDIAQGDEALQFLSVFYSSVLLVYLNKLSKHMKLSITGRYVAMIFAAFLPFSVMMSGALNNDLLMVTLSVMCVYYILQWYEKTDYKNIILAAVCLGCAMMTKISAALLAPGIAVIFLMKTWKDYDEIKKVLLQLLSFGLISVPLGMWFPVVKYIKYDTPFGFIPAMPDTAEQFIGQYSKWQRLFDFKGGFDSITLSWTRSETYMDHNIWVSLLKYAVTGEGYNVESNRIALVANISFYLTLVLLVVMVVAAILYVIFVKNSWHIKILYAVSILVSMASYISFCFRYPHICTMHIRYVMTALYIGILMFGGTVSLTDANNRKLSAKTSKIMNCVIVAVITLYMLITCLLYVNLEMLL